MDTAASRASVTPEIIKAIPIKYAIGKRPLSLMLGWGELTYTRLLDGTTPSPAHAKTLRDIHDNPIYYARALEQGRSRITDTAYQRSRRAVENILGESMDDATKIFYVADRFVELAGGDITPNALEKLLYYTQGIWLSRKGSPLFDQLPRAGVNGPAYDQVEATYSFDAIQEIASKAQNGSVRGNESRAAMVNGPSEGVTWDEADVIDAVFKRYGEFSGPALTRMTCSEGPWKKARKRASVSANEESVELLTAKSMAKFFKKNGI